MNTYSGKNLLVWICCCLGLLLANLLPARPTAVPDAFHRTYAWHFEGQLYVLEYDFPWETYHFYQERQRVFTNYAVYSYENAAHPFLPDFVHQLGCLAEERGLNHDETMRMVISFVQHLEYQPENGEYPKYPIETLAERGGDCEDTSILLAAMLREMGYATVLVNPPGHMAVAVACKDCKGTAYNQNGQRFYYVETTAPGYSIGDVPEDYKTTTDKILSMRARPSDLWVLGSFVPKRTPSGLVYFVSEDAGTQTGRSHRGDAVTATTTLKTVEVDGKFSQSKSISFLEVR
jgi:hypothetical protein